MLPALRRCRGIDASERPDGYCVGYKKAREMNGVPTSLAVPKEAEDAGTARKVRRHLLPLLFVLYLVAYLDRVNVGFASLTMNRELALTSEQYGLLSGVFFWGYF